MSLVHGEPIQDLSILIRVNIGMYIFIADFNTPIVSSSSGTIDGDFSVYETDNVNVKYVAMTISEYK
jgi:hypothetical protein